MAEKPILFSAPMIRAILNGSKTQTRRILKDQETWDRVGEGILRWHPRQRAGVPVMPGDILWVRESIKQRPMANFLTGEPTRSIVAAYAADDEDVVEEMGFNVSPWWKNRGALPAIHMPRWASRINLLVTDVRVQRLQDISEEDAKAEGCCLEWYADHAGEANLWPCSSCNGWGTHAALGANLGVEEVDCRRCDTAVGMFRELWNSINGAGSWESNPFVYALTFQRIQQQARAACLVTGQKTATATR